MAIKDKRLEKSDTFYRQWHDNYNTLLPPPQSIANPLAPELISTNIQTSGTIKKGYFGKPLVEAINTLHPVGKFDEYYLGIWREAGDGEGIGELPIHKPEVDYNEDLGLTTIWAKLRLILPQVFDDFGTVYGTYAGIFPFHYMGNKNQWLSDILPFRYHDFPTLTPVMLKGLCRFFTADYFDDLSHGFTIATDLFLQDVNLPISMIVYNCTAIVGNTQMPLISRNTGQKEFAPIITELTILGGE